MSNFMIVVSVIVGGLVLLFGWLLFLLYRLAKRNLKNSSIPKNVFVYYNKGSLKYWGVLAPNQYSARLRLKKVFGSDKDFRFVHQSILGESNTFLIFRGDSKNG